MNKIVSFICIGIYLFFNVLFSAYSLDNNLLIGMVKFRGNKTLKRKTLLNLIKVKAGEKFNKELLKTGLQNILEEYQNNGMPFVTVTPVTRRISSKQIQLIVKISEGSKLKIGNIYFEGNTLFSKRELTDKFQFQRGNLFTSKKFETGINRILRLYSENGYPLVEIKPVDFEVNQQGKIDLSIHIDEKELVKFSKVKVTGLDKTKPEVVLRELPIRPGSKFDQRKVDESYRILQNIGYFYDIKPGLLEPGSSPSKIVFNAEVTEARTGRISGVIGYNPEANKSASSSEAEGGELTGMLEVNENNLLGTGRKLNILWKSGILEVYRFEYEEPWLFGHPIYAGVEISAINESSANQNEQLNNILSKERTAGFSIGVHWHRKLEGKLKATYKMFDFPEANFDSMQSGSKYGVKLSLQRDSRDYILNPTQGRLDSGAFELSRGDFRLKKAWLDLNQYFSTWERQVLYIGLHGAVCYGEEIPPTELLYLGGSKTLRGYGENWFRGPKQFYSNIEYRFLVGRSSQIFLFTDLGSVTSVEKPNQFGNLKIGYGFGVRLESRSGILRIDYGLAKGDSPLEGKIHLNLGLVR